MLEDLNNIKNDIQELIEVKFDLLRLRTAESLSRILSSVVNVVILGFLLFFILLFLSVAAGYFLASLLQSNELGFLCVSGFYVLVMAIFIIFRKRIIERPIIKTIMKLIFPKSGEDEK